jgi:hypothetical protein
VKNNAGSNIQLFWMNPDGTLVSQTEKPIRSGNEAQINSYNTHRFLVKFVNGIPHKGEVSFTKGPYQETITIVNDGKRLVADQFSQFDEFQLIVDKTTIKCKGLTGSALSKCIASDLYKATAKERNKNTDITQYRDLMSSRLRNYTCADPTMKSSEPEKTKQLNVKGTSYTINTFLDMDSAKIWTVPNFITTEECKILMAHGKPRLTRATVAGEDGLGTISMNRRAQQASYEMRAGESEPLWFAILPSFPLFSL